MCPSVNSSVSPKAPFAIVVGVDFESEGTGALHEAFRVMREKGAATLHVVHVVPNTAAKNSRFSATLRSGYSEKPPGM